jgi:VanZ family protein
MSSSKRGLKYWISAWWPVAVGIAVIAMESTKYLGAEYTSGPLRWLFESILGRFSNATWDIVHHLVRKTGHFFGYGFIGLAWLRAWWMTLPNSRLLPDALLALLGTALVAGADEWHQTLLPNRTGSAWDALLDCCGAITLQFVVYMYFRLMKPKKLARAA